MDAGLNPAAGVPKLKFLSYLQAGHITDCENGPHNQFSVCFILPTLINKLTLFIYKSLCKVCDVKLQSKHTTFNVIFVICHATWFWSTNLRGH